MSKGKQLKLSRAEQIDFAQRRATAILDSMTQLNRELVELDIAQLDMESICRLRVQLDKHRSICTMSDKEI